MVDPPTVDLKAAPSLSGTVAGLTGQRVVYVGEVHTAYEDHLVQLEVLKGLHRQDPDLAIGVEWFQQPYQAPLDRYVAGEISEGEMLEATEYFTRWGFDYRLYRPILRYAREHGIPIIALNAPTEVTRAIGREGRDGVPAELRRYLPAEMAGAEPDYEARLRQVFDSHPERNGDFQRFLEVQLTWDESMAERAAAWLEANPGRRLVVMAGRGHIGHGWGIPSRVERRSGIAGPIVLVAHGDGAERGAADYLVLAAREELPAAGLMGVILESGEAGVAVKRLSPGSGAEAAGMQEGDIIVTIDGRPIAAYADVKLALMDKAPGQRVEVVVRRDGLFDDSERRLDIELKGDHARQGAPHP